MGIRDIADLLLKRAFRKRGGIHDGDDKKKMKEVSGQTPIHIAFNIILQLALIGVFVAGVEHEQYPKTPDVPDYPGLGEPGMALLLLCVVRCKGDALHCRRACGERAGTSDSLQALSSWI